MAYGSIERLVMLLDRALVANGHESVVLGLGGSRVAGDLEMVRDRAGYVAQVQRAVELADSVDVIHVHRREIFDLGAADWIRARLPRVKIVATLHGAPDRVRAYYADHRVAGHFVFVSRAQARGLPELSGTVVRNAIAVGDVPFGKRAICPAFVSFVGRIGDEKGVAEAIDVAAALGLPLKIGGVVQDQDQSYFETMIRPRLMQGVVDLVGPVDDDAKYALLGASTALMLLPKYEDPCPLVVIEALAAGTPVLGLARGGLPELVTDGVTGLLAADVDALVSKASRLSGMDRQACRRTAEARFDVQRMLGEYLRVYRGTSAPPSASRT